MEAIRQTLLTQWNFMRWLRLIVGVFFIAQAIQIHDAIAGFVGSLLLFQAFTNTGCCGAGGCAVPVNNISDKSNDEVEYEEVTAPVKK
jgi:hypothetical protein